MASRSTRSPPRGTPAAIVSRLNADLAQIVKLPDVQERYRAAGVWGGRTIPQELRAMAAQRPDAPAMATPDAVTTYAELDRTTDRIALGLRDQVRDRVGAFAALGLPVRAKLTQ